jgi:hypothetical protein
VLGFPCGPAQQATYPVDADPRAPCEPDAPHIWILVEGFQGEFDELLAAAGSATIVSIDEAALGGTFSADFGGEGALSGSFNALACAE